MLKPRFPLAMKHQYETGTTKKILLNLGCLSIYQDKYNQPSVTNITLVQLFRHQPFGLLTAILWD
jgi:hypothetical protein